MKSSDKLALYLQVQENFPGFMGRIFMCKFVLPVLIFIIFQMGGLVMAKNIPEIIRNMIDSGRYKEATEALKKEAEKKNVSEKDKKELLFEVERFSRIKIDFTLKIDEVLEQIREQIPEATMEDIKKWTDDATLESRLIDNERLYFKRAVRNLFILNKKAAARRKKQFQKKKEKKKFDKHGQIIDLRVHAKNTLEARKNSASSLVTPQRFRVDYSLYVKAGQVPAGEIIRCWLCFPKEVPTQTDIIIKSSIPEKYSLAPNDVDQRTIYFEQPSRGDEPTTFSVSFEYTAYAFVEPVDPEKVKVYNTETDLYKKYTSERPSQIEFLPEIIELAKKLCGDEKNPYRKAKKLFEWVQGNIIWSSAIEYSIVPNLGMRALKRKTGDCGMQGLLLVSLCRASGIPARWQSGWSLRPDAENMHDWMQFYIEPYGWLYADPSRGLFDSEDEEIRWFNFGNFDRYRLIVNTDYGSELHPPKKYFRSETVDFQRGEVEWKGGNLYFDKWGWDFTVTPIKMGK
jgi:transglutaminase-like putative cysteine protease